MTTRRVLSRRDGSRENFQNVGPNPLHDALQVSASASPERTIQVDNLRAYQELGIILSNVTRNLG